MAKPYKKQDQDRKRKQKKNLNAFQEWKLDEPIKPTGDPSLYLSQTKNG